jgi:hypothetical protein
MFFKVSERYSEAVKEATFVKYEKELAEKVNRELANAFASNMREEDMVENLNKLIDAFGAISQPNGNLFIIEPKTAFIHGCPSRSGVEFFKDGKKERCEMGDLVFILSVAIGYTKYFEKITFCQFKKEDRCKTNWKIDENQLFLLSRFPTFNGVKGSAVPPRQYNLANHSECLGSYGLFYRPGEFAFVSAKWLSHYMGNAKSIDGNDLFALSRYIDAFRRCPSICFNNCYMRICCRHSTIVLGNDLFAFNVYDFVDRYLRGNVGECVLCEMGDYDPEVKGILYDLMNNLKLLADREDNSKMKELVANYLRYEYVADMRRQKKDTIKRNDEVIEFNTTGSSGWFGIVHVTIKLKGE